VAFYRRGEAAPPAPISQWAGNGWNFDSAMELQDGASAMVVDDFALHTG
jgi:hypothetical protein